MTTDPKLSEAEQAARDAWYAYCDTHELPPDIPRDPDVVYRGQGWRGWVDWIGGFDA